MPHKFKNPASGPPVKPPTACGSWLLAHSLLVPGSCGPWFLRSLVPVPSWFQSPIRIELELEQINTNPNDTEANALGRSKRACDARKQELQGGSL